MTKRPRSGTSRVRFSHLDRKALLPDSRRGPPTEQTLAVPAQASLEPTTMEIVATALFAVAVLHTFMVKRIEVLAHRRPRGSVSRNLLELLGEVEVVFGLWAMVLIVTLAGLKSGTFVESWVTGGKQAFQVDFTEPMFVFAIMSVAATRPVLASASSLVAAVARPLPIAPALAGFGATLVVGPLLGSLITGPAAMTVTALVLKRAYFDRGLSTRLQYATIGTLFVNVSIGGTLTSFAAPPVLMVAETWGWDSWFMATHIGWKSAIAVVVNAVLLTYVFRSELLALGTPPDDAESQRARVPAWLMAAHLACLAGIVAFAHTPVLFMGVFLLFLGIADVTQDHQDPLRLRQALLVAFFLGGLVVLGSLQPWWLKPLLAKLDAGSLFLGTAALTSVTDNAALTYLGSLVPDLAMSNKLALVGGAVAGGGLTVIANAPNPAGYGILRPSFGPDGISPLGLLAGSLIPTCIALAAIWYLPNL